MNKLVALSLATCVVWMSCEDAQTTVTPSAMVLVNNIDSTVNPADDFFAFANGSWIKANPIPSDESSWGIAHLVFNELDQRKKHIIEEAIAAKKPTIAQQQVASFYKAAMDTVLINKLNISPLLKWFQKIEAITSREQLSNLIGELKVIGVNAFFDQLISQDDMNSDQMAVFLWQGGLGLPDRDYYFNTDPHTKDIRNEYVKYIATMLSHSGVMVDTALDAASAVYNFELELAKVSRKIEDLRDPYENYHKIAINQFHNYGDGFDIYNFLKSVNIDQVDSLIIGQPEFFKGLSALMTKTPLAHLQYYLKFHLINTYAPYLSKDIEQVHFNFYSKKINGIEKQKPRWKRIIKQEDKMIGEVLGQLFVKEYFNEKTKKRYEDLVEAIRQAFKERIKNLDWMTEATKAKAIEKLEAVKKKVGYPDKWKDFSNLTFTDTTYVDNIIAVETWWHLYSVNKLGKPVDRTEWHMPPQTYNAYYSTSNNEIVLPAGIFTIPGYRDEEIDEAIIYGYAGASTIGHEFTHGFDDQGRKYDKEGNLNNWWTEEDMKEFEKRTQVLIDQFNGMRIVDNIFVNGKATIGENLADLGGIVIGLDAFKQTETYKSNIVVNGLTPLQRYFLGYALGWLYQTRPEELASRSKTDVHSPAKQRVNGPMPNVDAFYEAFNVKPNNKMYIPDSNRAKVW